MKTFHCSRCAQLVFFENVRCERCDALLGYVPELGEISAFEPAGNEGVWRSLHPGAEGGLYRRCDNYALHDVCNWMIPAAQTQGLCRSCALARIIPNLNSDENRSRWYRLETAKRRLLYTLGALGLPVDPEQVAFEFLEDTADGERVVTGHDRGLITLNVAEADDAHRETVRAQMHEPYRTLLGHFRHEIGHYYFDLLVANTRRIEPFRTMFGDEREDYGAALERHYRNGPPQNWVQSFVSAYASTHPWEDWAETWAHYLHMVDTLDTATSCGLMLVPDDPAAPSLDDMSPVEDAAFETLMNRWFPLTYALNSLNRSLGMPDGYPFALAPAVIEKLRFVHRVIAGGVPTRNDAEQPGPPTADNGSAMNGSEAGPPQVDRHPGGTLAQANLGTGNA